MKTYVLYIKNPVAGPDYEDECEAESFEEAAKVFSDRMPRSEDNDWGPKDLLPHIEEFVDCERCGGETGSRLVGDESYNYCKDCNWVTH